jgi:acyl carrier protein
VKEAAVLAREDAPGDKRLVAYVTSKTPGEAPLTADVLRTHLKPVLPDHMVPSAFVVLDSFPISPNGKLDRRALPAPDVGAYVSRQSEGPQGEVEQILASVWKELLRIERIGRQDNFFELGGHSLHGLKLIARIAEHLAVRLPVVAMFEYPSIQQLAEVIESHRRLGGQPPNSGEMEFDEGVLSPPR